jgi:DNA primase (bacterial type)
MDDRIKDQISTRLEEYLGYRSIDCKRPFRCLNPDHPDRHPSMAFDPKRNRAHCFSCGVDYDIYDIIGIDYGIADFPGRLEKSLV